MFSRNVFALALVAALLAGCGPAGPAAPSPAPAAPPSEAATPAPAGSYPTPEASPTATRPIVSATSVPLPTREASPVATRILTPLATTPGPTATAMVQTASPTPASTKPITLPVQVCLATAVSGSIGVQGATQALAGDLVLTNRGQSACALDGRPKVGLVDANGKALAVSDVSPPDASPTPRLVLDPGQSAYLRLFWRNWCGPVPAFPLQVSATWPGAGTAVSAPLLSGAPSEKIPLHQAPVCNASNQGSTLSVYPFRPTP